MREAREPTIQFVLWYIGQGVEHVLLCEQCAAQSATRLAAPVCQECFEFAAHDVGAQVAVGGKPEIRERLEQLPGEFRECPAPETVVDLASTVNEWLVLTETGRICRLDGTLLATTDLDREPGHKPWVGRQLNRRLHVSEEGTLAAVVNDYGRFGEILDLGSGRVTTTLQGGSYYSETVPFSFCFARLRGRLMAIHRTSSGRVDVTEPRTGVLVTERSSPGIDYVYGRLHLNPSGTRIASDGWSWHPVGIVLSWDTERWLDNPSESEAGQSVRALCYRDYYWDAPMIWLDDNLLAVHGLGDDEELLVDGARIFDLSLPGDQCEVTSFAGPAGPFFSDGRYLYSSNPEGLSRWDPSDGALTGRIPGFQPTHYHRASREFAQVRDGKLVIWRSIG